MISAALDASVLASGIVRANPAAPPSAILDAWHERKYLLVVSERILRELERTLGDRYFRQRLSTAQIEAALALLRAEALLTPITVNVTGVATHPEDDLVLATEASADASDLVTGDAALRGRVPLYAGVRLVSPREFLTILAAEASPGT